MKRLALLLSAVSIFGLLNCTVVAMVDSAALTYVAASELVPSSPDKIELTKLQGSWTLKAVEWLGERTDQDPDNSAIAKSRAYRNALPEERELPPEVPEKHGIILEIKGNRFSKHSWLMRGGCILGSETVTNGPLKLSARGNLKVIEGRSMESTWRWLYSVEGDTLRICTFNHRSSGKVPTEFNTASKDDVLILIFERARK